MKCYDEDKYLGNPVTASRGGCKPGTKGMREYKFGAANRKGKPNRGDAVCGVKVHGFDGTRKVTVRFVQ